MEISKDQQTITIRPEVTAGIHVAVDYDETRANCANCSFNHTDHCTNAPCMGWERSDKRNVIFIKSE